LRQGRSGGRLGTLMGGKPDVCKCGTANKQETPLGQPVCKKKTYRGGEMKKMGGSRPRVVSKVTWGSTSRKRGGRGFGKFLIGQGLKL